MLNGKYKYYVVINILFKLNITSIIDTYFLVKVSHQSTLQSLLGWAYLDRRCPDFVGEMQVLLDCYFIWIGFMSICCSKVAKEGKKCPRFLVLQRVPQKLPSTICLCLFRPKRRNKISSAMLFASIFSQAQRACTFDISAERNVWLQSALRLFAIVCDYVETALFAIVCDLRSAIVCDHMETSLQSFSVIINCI